MITGLLCTNILKKAAVYTSSNDYYVASVAVAMRPEVINEVGRRLCREEEEDDDKEEVENLPSPKLASKLLK